MKTLAVIPLLLLPISVLGQSQSSQSPAARQIAFARPEHVGDSARSFFIFSTAARNYTIRHDGLGEGSTSSGFRKTFSLKMGGAPRLAAMYFAECDGDLILEYEVTESAGNWGYLARLDQKKLKFKWVTPINGALLGPGLILQNELYFAASNFVGKLELRSGSYIWQQSQLEHFYSLSLPSASSETLVFQNEMESQASIEVSKETGRLIKP